ncbi:MAG: esterase-like activity of phytase family protein [Caldilineaceae bacterium]
MRNHLAVLLLIIVLLLASACQPIQPQVAGTTPAAEAGAPPATPPYRQRVTNVDFLGEATFATGAVFADTELGGLSGLVYDAEHDLYYAISDDRSQRNPARFYTLTINLSDDHLDDGDVVFQGVTTLLDESGAPYAENGIDPEGIARTAAGRLFISSEGNVNAEPPLNPFIREYTTAGDYVADVALPAYYLPNADRTSGIRNNLAFESLTVSLDQQYLWTAVEGALAQDGPIADLETGSLVRVLQIDLGSGEPAHEYVYTTDPIPQAPDPADGSADNGLVDLLPLDTSGTFLAMERAYAQGVGNNIRLYQAQTNGARDVLGTESLLQTETEASLAIDLPVTKTLLANLGELGATLDNMEGMAYGPVLPDGRQTVILVSDNNFNEGQQTVFVALALTLENVPTPSGALATPLTVMTFNIWGGGANEDKPVDETVAAIRAAGADIIGVQETRLESDPCTAESCPATGDSVVKAIADALGFYYYDQTQENAALWANAIISRYPIGEATPNDLGVPIDVNGRTVYAFNIHLTDFPYQPYQLLNIEYGDAPFLATAEEAVAAAQAARGPALELLKADLAAADGADAAFIFGDFNEPSHWDWTEAAVQAGLQPLVVAWPTTLAIENQGFVDAFRTANPDVVAKPAFTWTPTSDPSDPEDHHDRIDFVFARGAGLVVEEAQVVGEKSPEADIIVTPWPSDHRAIVAKVRF